MKTKNKTFKNIDQSDLLVTIKSLKNKFLTVHAIKKDGSKTVINGQIVESPPSYADNPSLFCIKKGGINNGFRTFSIDKVESLHCNNEVLTVVRR